MIVKDKIKSYRERTGKTLPQIADEANISLGNLYQWSRGKEVDMTDELKRLISYIDDGVVPIKHKDQISNQVISKEKPKPITPLAMKISQFQQLTGKSIVDIATESGVPKGNIYKWSRNVVPRVPSEYEKIASYLDQLESEIKIAVPMPLSERITKLQNRSGKSLPTIAREANIKFDTLYKWKMGAFPRISEQYKRFILYLDKMETIRQGYGGATIAEITGAYCEKIIQVTGESMEPTFKYGSKLAVSGISNQNLIVWGDYYYIVYKSLNNLIRRVYPTDNGCLRLEADQMEKYPTIIQSWDEIESVYKIVAVITIL